VYTVISRLITYLNYYNNNYFKKRSEECSSAQAIF
jgi:hypothetical protein